MIISNSFTVIYGNTFSINPRLKLYGFTFDWNNKYWYKLASEQYYKICERDLSNEDIAVFHVSDLSQVPRMIKDFNDFKKEVGQQEEVKPIQGHKLSNKVVEVSKWFSTKLKEQKNLKFAFRNLTILNIYKETPNAYLVDCEYFGGVGKSCGCCGRDLDNKISIATGIGPVCAERIGMPRVKTLEEAQIIIDEMSKMSKDVGVIKQVWIPKSQIRAILGDENKAA